jgi:hypothetical protein
MDIVISANNAFCKWLKLDLPRVTSKQGKGVGIQPLITNANRLSFQVHAIETDANDCGCRDLIVVEAYTRYTMIFPNMKPMNQNNFEGGLILRWGNELIHYMLEEKAIQESDVQSVVDSIQSKDYKFHWIQNTDASVNGHLTDTQQWMEENYRTYGYAPMDFEECFSLAHHVNQFRKKRKISTKPVRYERFYPIDRFVEDGLFRFSNKGKKDLHPKEPFKKFPQPYKLAPSKAELMVLKESTDINKTIQKVKSKNNIISITELRNKKRF